MSHLTNHTSRRLLMACAGLLLVSTGCRATNGWAFNNSGKGYYAKGNYAMARDEFRRAAIDDPCNADYRHNLALAMKRTGDVAGAERVLRANLEQANAMHQPTYHSLSQLLVEQNRQPEAQQLLAGWAQTQPYVPEAHVELAWIQRESGNIPGAEQSLRQALQMNPQHPTATAHLGQLYQDSGQPDRAAAMYQRSLAARWQQPQVQSRMKMLSDGSARFNSRSAMMVNPGYGQPTYAYGPQMPMAMGPTPISSPIISSQPQPMTNSNPLMAAAPSLGPTPDPMASSISTNSIPQFQAPIIAGPVLTPNADPAHAGPEMTAELPMVEPH